LIFRGRELTFRATVTDMAMFDAELRALNAVDTTTWLRAMPPSVVKTADSTTTIRVMLEGIPLPPGFDAARIRGAGLVHGRYQLGAAVTGTVACMWIADWSRAGAVGDSAMVKRAIAAMATSPHWAILREMATQGAWPQVLIMFAHEMPHGTSFGRPLDVAADSGLGCSEWGVHLPGTSALGLLRSRASLLRQPSRVGRCGAPLTAPSSSQILATASEQRHHRNLRRGRLPLRHPSSATDLIRDPSPRLATARDRVEILMHPACTLRRIARRAA
jgi:hypothetical protein